MIATVANDAGIEIVHRLRRACEAHEPAIADHLDRVSHYSCVIARLLGWTPLQVQYLELASPLHDLGKIGVPLTVLNKPGRLTGEEMLLVQSHTVIGYRILDGSTSPLLQCAARIALYHHESWDGRGYPHQLVGRSIPIEARIVAIADVYDALLSQRAYKPAWSEDAVLRELRRLRGAKFDPEILDLFLAHTPAATPVAS